MSELITRLNPKTCRFDVGSGGLRDLEDQDIAAGLGMCSNKLGVGVLCYIYWPEGLRGHFEYTRVSFEVHLLNMLWNKSDNVDDAIVNAEISYMNSSGSIRLKREVDSLVAKKGEFWPHFNSANLPRYVRVVVGVLDEILAGPTCKRCNGRAKLVTAAGVNECEPCGGTGRADESQRARAERMGVNLSSYQRRWDEPYRWLMGELSAAKDEANAQFRRALGRRSAA